MSTRTSGCRYRYLDMRRERMQRNLRVRAAVNSAIRAAMERQGFVEVETPMLMPSTPEGAREFLVPSRQTPGSFYALPQSPQLFKQLLMVGGFDRYYQIARCLRDEDLRADRQYEFMQLDAEMSFVDQDDVLAAIGEAVLDAAEAVDGGATAGHPSDHVARGDGPLRRRQARSSLRHGARRADTGVRRERFKAFAGAAAIKGMRVPGRRRRSTAGTSSTALTDRAKQLGAKGLVWLKVAADATFESPVAKFISDEERKAIVETARQAEPGDLLLLVADEWTTAVEVLGQLRNDLGRPPVHEGPYRYVWVVDFPMFVGIDDATGRPKPGHHPFTRPHPDDVDRLESDPMSVRSLAYDLVLNGWELGSGSIRIHEPELQQRVFDLLGIGAEEANATLRVLPHPVPLRRAAPRWVRLRHRPPGRHPRRRGEHPRGDRLPEDPVGLRPDDERAYPGRRPAAPRARPEDPPPEGMNDTTWLAADPVVERIELDGASWVDVVRGLVPDADAVHDDLAASVPWEQGKVFRYERWIDEPRLGAVQNGEARHPSLREAQLWIMRRYRIQLPASVPLALYRNERDGVGFHRDREMRWLEDTVIGVLTLGARRPWLMKPLGRGGQRTFDEDDDLHRRDRPVAGQRGPARDGRPVPGGVAARGTQVQGRCRSRISAQWRWTSRRGRRDPNPSYYAPRHFGR